MKLPPGVTFHFGSWTFRPGDDVPPELESRLPEEVRLAAGKAKSSPTPEAAEPAPEGKRR